ncbi:unnamed protein product [Arabis nemorensis]|uniref:PGG domain-containing protein n=1 Tax=Arabis nemorensis TaxID=586526 RepID=A0A565APM5_9BRAS|nr:unnamed protein product [Arabis nemorensis]
MVLRNEVNGDGLTFLDILRTHGQIDEGGDLEQVALKTGCKEAAYLPKMTKTYDFFKSPITFWTYCSTHTRRISYDTSDEARGVFLIICTLLITATYQTALQPPGGVNQTEGRAVMKQTFFIFLWVSNTIGFCCAIFYTFCLLPARGASLCVSYALAMAVISPQPLVFLSACFALYLLFPFYVLMEVFVRQWRRHQTVAPDPGFSWFWKLHVAAASGNIPFAMEMLNLKRKLNTNGYSPLHLAVEKDHREFIRWLLWLDPGLARVKGREGITPFHLIAGRDLDLEQLVVKTGCKEKTSDHFKSPITFWTHCSIGIRRLRSDTSEEGRAVFLIICTLIITSTYQTALQPPGGVHQSENENGGSAVMKQTFFIVLWISNTIGFCCALLYTLSPPTQ